MLSNYSLACWRIQGHPILHMRKSLLDRRFVSISLDAQKILLIFSFHPSCLLSLIIFCRLAGFFPLMPVCSKRLKYCCPFVYKTRHQVSVASFFYYLMLYGVIVVGSLSCRG